MVNNQNEIKCRNCQTLNLSTATKCEFCGHNLRNGFPVKPIVIGLATLTVGAVGYFGLKIFSPSGQNTNADFIVLGDSFSGYSTFRNAEFQKLVKDKVGLSLQYQDEPDQKKRAELLKEGKAGLLVTSLDQFIQQKPPGKIIGLIDRTVGADAVVLNAKKYPKLKSILDLSDLLSSQGQKLKIAYAGDTPSEYLALFLSTKYDDFKLSDFEQEKVEDASKAWELLQDDKKNVAVAIIWEPYVTQAEKKGYRVLVSTEDYENIIVDVIVAADRLISAQPDKLSEFLAAYYEYIDAGVLDSSKLQNQITADDKNLIGRDATAVLNGIHFFRSLEARNWLKDGTLEQRIKYTAGVLNVANKISEVPQNPQELYNSELIAEAAKNAESSVVNNPDLERKLKGETQNQSRQNNVSDIKDKPSVGNLKVEGDIKFATDSANITLEGKSALDSLAKEIGQQNSQRLAIRVIGHTSKTGNDRYNLGLSEERAKAVVDYLSPKLSSYKIVSEGKGFNQPLPKLSPDDIRNQRTEIRVVRIN